MDQDTARRIDQLEQAVAALRQRTVDTVGTVNGLAESTIGSFAKAAQRSRFDDGAHMAERVIISALLGAAAQATRTHVQAALQVAYEAHAATGPHPLMLQSFREYADSVFPGIELKPAAE